jgi:hypothetical protein
MCSRKTVIRALMLLMGSVTACTASQPTAGPEPTLHAQKTPQRSSILSVRAGSKLMPHDQRGGSAFGDAVALSGDTAVIGASNWGAPPGTQAGAAYVYQRSEATWTEIAKLAASDADADYQYDGQFGRSVAINGDTIVVGAPKADDPTAGENCGAAYVFHRSGETWTEQAKLIASDAAADDGFGNVVAVNEDQDTIVVGGGRDSDAVYVFQHDGTAWIEQARLTGGDWFGGSMAISGDTLVVGAGLDSGADAGWGLYVFHREGNTWTEQARLTPGDTTADNRFGISVAFRGNTLVVGAPGDRDAGLAAGAVYVFHHDGAEWTEQAKLTASDATAMNAFGLSVAIEGNTIVVGTPWDTIVDRQAAWVFQWDGDTWHDQLKLTGSDDWFGSIPVAISGNTVMVGAPGEFGHAVYVYELESR